MDDYEQYEADCETTRKANQTLLDAFEAGLTVKGLTQKTADSHRSNVDFYINEYLLYEEVIQPEDGVHAISTFLGYWFPRKALWASPGSIKSNAASLKKFYTFLHQQGRVSKDDLVFLNAVIKEEMPGWLETAGRY